MQTIAVHHVSINVDDVDEALRFYVDVLGLSPRGDRPDLGIGGAWLDVGGQQVHLSVRPRRRTSVSTSLSRWPTSTRASPSCAPGHRRTDPMVIGTGRQAFLEDPSGNAVELHQPAAV